MNRLINNGQMQFTKMAKPAGLTERQIVFVASDACVDRSEEIVQIESFYLPMKKGEPVQVINFTAGNNLEVDIPLLTDHNGWEIESCIGSVRKAEYIDGKLIFTCGIASTARAQEMLKLLEEGHLNNAFSIGWRGGDYDFKTREYTGGEIIEVSLVTRGCNPDANLLDIKDSDNDNNGKNERSNTMDPENQTETTTAAATTGSKFTEAEIKEAEAEAKDEAKLEAERAAEAKKEADNEADKEAEAEEKLMEATKTKSVETAESDPDAAEARAEYAQDAQRAIGAMESHKRWKKHHGYKSLAEADAEAAETIVLNGVTYHKGIIGVKETNDNLTNERSKTMDPENDNHKIATAGIQAPSQKVAVKDNARGYLDTAEANHDFAKFIVDNYGKSNSAIIKAWADKMKQKGITGDAILPTTISQIFFKVWTNESGILSHFKSARLLQGSTYAVTTKNRGYGHKKGEKKDDVTFETIRRDYKAKIGYARMPIDLQDLIDDTTGELLTLRTELLADLLYNEFVRAAIIGDGRTGSSDDGSEHDHRFFDDTKRGVWSMLSDLENAGKSGDSEQKYGDAVVTKVENNEGDNDYDKAMKVLYSLKGSGQKILVAAPGYIEGLMTAKGTDGHYLFAPGTDYERVLRCRIYEFDFMSTVAEKFELIGFNAGSYLFPSGADMIRSVFDTEYNTDILLHEKPVTGTLFGRKVCAGYAAQASEAA